MGLAIAMASASVATASAQSSSWTANPWAGSPEVVAAANGGGPIYDIQSIKQLKGRYFRYVDTKNWSGLRGLYTDDAVVDTTGSLGPIFYGPDSFIAFTSLTLSTLQTAHHGFTPRIKLTSPTTAEGNWVMEDRLHFPGLLEVHGYGHYQEEYQKVDGKWLFKRSALTRSRLDVTQLGPLKVAGPASKYADQLRRESALLNLFPRN